MSRSRSRSRSGRRSHRDRRRSSSESSSRYSRKKESRKRSESKERREEKKISILPKKLSIDSIYKSPFTNPELLFSSKSAGSELTATIQQEISTASDIDKFKISRKRKGQVGEIVLLDIPEISITNGDTVMEEYC
jgi:hypothetical protein